MAERTCTILECGKRHEARGLCPMHYRRFRLYGDPLATAPRKHPERCTVTGCDREFYGKGLCEPHYARQRLHGGLDDMRANATDPADRFWPRVSKGQGCWLWQGPPNGSGYGTFRLGEQVIGAHVMSVMLDGRDIPDGMEVDHLCFTPMCARPDHLEVVTHDENQRRRRMAKAS